MHEAAVLQQIKKLKLYSVYIKNLAASLIRKCESVRPSAIVL